MAELADIGLFKNLSQKNGQAITSAAKNRHLDKYEQLFMHGEKLGSIYVVLEGAVREFRHAPDGKDITIELATKGNAVGASHLFEAFGSYQWNAMAVEPSTVLEFPISWFRDHLKTDNVLALNLLASMSQQAHATAIDTEQRITFSTSKRLACFLLRICALHGFDPGNFKLPYSKTTIATKLGMELPTLSRSLKKLEAVGVLIRGTQVQIADVHALECFVCGHCSIADDCDNLIQLKNRHCKHS